jgi:hypothetical protein
MQAAWKRELWRETIARSEDSCSQLPRMSLHLIAVLVHAAEEICAAMNIEHDSPPLPSFAGPFGVVATHLYPFRSQL